MMTNKAIRVESWQLLWREGWMWRGMAVAAVLGGILCCVVGLIAALYAYFGVESLAAFQKAKLSAARAGLNYTAPTQAASISMYSASLFQKFMQYLFSGLMMAGVTSVMLKAARRDETKWFSESFIGYRMPLGMFWLWFREGIQTALWITMTLVPCLVVAGVAHASLGLPLPVVAVLASIPAALVMFWIVYRYRLCWYFKIDNPELSAGQCLRNSIDLMQGQKMRAVSLDCSYWPWFLLMVPFVSVLAFVGYQVAEGGFGSLSPVHWLLAALSNLAALVFVVLLGWWMSLAHAVFYRELIGNPQQSAPESTQSPTP